MKGLVSTSTVVVVKKKRSVTPVVHVQKSAPAPTPPCPSVPPPDLIPLPEGLNKSQRRNARRRIRFLASPEFTEVSRVMVERWPHVFSKTAESVRPFAIGIHTDLQIQLSQFAPALVNRTFQEWRIDHYTQYLKALIHGGPRYDLDGNIKGEVTAEQQAHAHQKYEEFKARHKKQKKAKTTS